MNCDTWSDGIYVVSMYNRFMVIPDMLKNAPMFKRLDARIKVCFVLGYHYFLYHDCLVLFYFTFLCRVRAHLLELGEGELLQCVLR